MNRFFRVCHGLRNRPFIPLLLLLTCVSTRSRADSYGDFLYSASGTNITITGYTGSNGTVNIPSSVLGVGTVTSIGNWAFENCTSLASVVIPNSATSIGNGAFSRCTNLTSVTIPNSVTNIGIGVFENCANLTSMTIPDSVTSIGLNAFSGCANLTSVTIPNSVTNIGYKAFFGCASLTTVIFPNNVTSIGYAAFSDCTSLTSVTIPNSVINIGDGAFSRCASLTSVIIGNSVVGIGYATFIGCASLTSVTIPNSVTNIGNYAFSGCASLTSVTIPNSVTSIGSYAFSGCASLTSVTIPNSVTSIGAGAFSDCYSLASAYFQGKAPASFGVGVFGDAASGFTIYYPATATGWSTPIWKWYSAKPYTVELNTAPQFVPLAATNYLVNPGVAVLVTNVATDADLPVQTLTFALLAGPAGASVDPGNGLFAWRPAIAQAGTTNTVSIVVSDSGTPSLSATQSLTVTVLSTTAPTIEPLHFVAGIPTLTITGIPGPDYVIQVSTNLVDWRTAATNVSPATFPLQWADTTAPAPLKFYRVRLAP